jgi:hypothetical protein
MCELLGNWYFVTRELHVVSLYLDSLDFHMFVNFISWPYKLCFSVLKIWQPELCQYKDFTSAEAIFGQQLSILDKSLLQCVEL